MEAPSMLEVAQIERLASQYFQLVEIQHLSFPSSSSRIKSNVQQLIYDTMFDEATIWPMPPVWYRYRVLKSLISKLEAAIIDPNEDEINDDIVSSWGELISLPRRPSHIEAQELSYIRYTAPSIIGKSPRPYVITSENRNLILASGTTGYRTWEAALHLGTFLSTPAGHALIQRKDVIEIGCGIGFLSMYCLKCLDAKTVTASDMEPGLLNALDDCINKNGLDQQRIKGKLWNWSDPFHDASDRSGTTFDVAIGADLIYDPDVVPLLLRAIDNLFANHGVKQFVIAATLRNATTFDLFVNGCAKHGLTCDKIDFQSPPREKQDGLYHPTDDPINTYIVALAAARNRT